MSIATSILRFVFGFHFFFRVFFYRSCLIVFILVLSFACFRSFFFLFSIFINLDAFFRDRRLYVD